MTTASGLRALRQIQARVEATSGTELIPGSTNGIQLVGTLGMRMEQELYMPDDLETGRLASFERSAVIARETSLPFESDANYEQIEHFLRMAIRETGSTTRIFIPDYDSSNSYTSYTFVYGDDQYRWKSSYVLARQLELSGSVGEVVRISADLFGRQMLEHSPAFANIGVPTLTAVKMAEAALYVSASNSGQVTAAQWSNIIGRNDSVKVPATLVDFNYRIATGLSPLKFADNRLDFSVISQAKRNVELDMTVGFNTTTKAWFNSLFANQQPAAFGIGFTGGGNARLGLNLNGFMTEFAELTEREGQDIVRLKVVSAYNPTASVASDMQVNVVIP